MKISGIDFNEDYWKGKKEADFLKHEAHHGLGEAKLKEVFALMNPKDKKIEPPPLRPSEQ